MFCLCNLLTLVCTLFLYVFVFMLNRDKKKQVNSFFLSRSALCRSALCQWNAGLHSIIDFLYTAKHCPCLLTLFISLFITCLFSFLFFLGMVRLCPLPLCLYVVLCRGARVHVQYLCLLWIACFSPWLDTKCCSQNSSSWPLCGQKPLGILII